MRQLRLLLTSTAFLGVFCAPLFAQSNDFQKPAPRVTQAVDNTRRAALPGEVHPLVKRALDLGPVDGAQPMERITLMLKRSDAQQRSLDKLNAEQQDKASPNFHRWLTPKEFGERFGPADSDIQQLTNWLRSEGFQIDKVANGRAFIEFSGTAAQVSSGFHTSIHNYSVNGEAHIANSTKLSIPAALAPVVLNVPSLNDFKKTPLHYQQPPRFGHMSGDASRPFATFPSGFHALAPADYAVIYDIQPTYTANINGSGRTIAVVGRSNVSTVLLNNFRKVFLVGGGTYSTIVNGTDPGRLGGNEEPEAYLDNQWTSAVAPGAAIKFVVSKSTSSADGVDLSENYIIDNDGTGALGHVDVMTESFGTCEANNLGFGPSVSLLAQQAITEGITYIVSTGDSGAATCADPNSGSATGADANPSVNILASTPFTVAVGGTQFHEGNCTIGSDGTTLTCDNEAGFWTTGNTSTFASAKARIPEVVWNEACPATTTGTVTGCTAANANLFAAGGGTSVLYAKPSWQKLVVAGIPAADHRYVPDVSLSAAGHDPYLICADDVITAQHTRVDCDPDPSTGGTFFSAVLGTSASAPSFAGMVALLDQKMGGSQGDIHAGLYKLAAQETFSGCNGSSETGGRASTCIFNDVTVGNNAVPGMANYGGPTALYQAGVGFDQASGLGSVDVTNLLNSFASTALAASTTALTVSPATSTIGASVVLTATVTGTGGTPTGTVTFSNSNSVTLGTATLSSGVATLTTTTLPAGTYTVTASYGGDTAFSASSSTAVNVTVTAVATTTALTIAPTTSSFGDSVTFTTAVTGTGGTPTGTVTFSSSNSAVSIPQATLGSGGTVTFNTTSLPTGTYTVTASYSGDSTFAPSTSAAVSLTVNQLAGATFTMSASPASVSLPSKGAVTGNTSTVTITSTGGFSGTVALSCAVTAKTPPATVPPTCSISPGSVALGASGTATVTFGSAAPTAKPIGTYRASGGRDGWLAAGGIALAGVLFFGFPRRRNWGAMLGLLLFAVMAGSIGCGSGNGSNHTPGTTSGTYAAVVTGTSGSQSVTTTVTVIVP